MGKIYWRFSIWWIMKTTQQQFDNAGVLWIQTTYYCFSCDKAMPDCWPMAFHDGEAYCGDCAYKTGIITQKECLKNFYFFIGMASGIAIIDGEVIPYIGKHPGRHRSDKEARRLPEYRVWRESVLERDLFLCVKCESTDKLEAHHIKSFKKHKEKRHDIKNGMTLCNSCHIQEHSKKVFNREN